MVQVGGQRSRIIIVKYCVKGNVVELTRLSIGRSSESEICINWKLKTIFCSPNEGRQIDLQCCFILPNILGFINLEILLTGSILVGVRCGTIGEIDWLWRTLSIDSVIDSLGNTHSIARVDYSVLRPGFIIVNILFENHTCWHNHNVKILSNI